MSSLIRDRAATTMAMLEVFEDEALVQAALRFELALARAEAAEGLISQAALNAILEASAAKIDVAILADSAAHAGTLAIALVGVLRARIARTDPEAAAALHKGATSQDLADTALMLQAKAALGLLNQDLDRLLAALTTLAAAHAATPMIGRTLLQSALPITFGLKVAGWRAALQDARVRLLREADDALALQFGGAVGTRAGLAGKGHAVAIRMARELDLRNPTLPWHSARGPIAGLAAALAILTAVLGKVARDLSLLAQSEIAEAHEPVVAGRGGSSAMAHKRNPTGCQVALSAAARAPGLLAGIVGALPQEHERGLGGWQAEGPMLVDLFQLTHGALAALTPVIGQLDVDTVAMARNLALAGVASDVGEAAVLVRAALSPSTGFD